MSKDMDEQLKLALQVVDVSDRPYFMNCVTLLRFKMNKPQSSYAQIGIFAREKEDEKFQQVVHVISKLEDIIDLLDVINPVFRNVSAIKPICNVL